MNILALDSATAACSVAVWKGDGVVSSACESMARGHAVRLMPMVRDVMKAANLGFDQLDMVATTIGPGGFTGLRIGLAGARALALAAGAPIVGFTTLRVIAHEQALAGDAENRPILVVLDAKRADFYFQLFDSAGVPQTEPAAAPIAEIATTLAATAPNLAIALCGDGAGIVLDDLRAHGIRVNAADGPAAPSAAILAELAFSGASIAGCAGDATAARPEPLYLRPPDAALPRR